MPQYDAMRENDAPNAAAFDMPRVYGEASGLRRTLCITAPDIARVAPITTAASTRGILTRHMSTARVESWSSPRTTARLSRKVA